ncbi:putative NADH dehydrogenase protein, partial [Naja naja]
RCCHSNGERKWPAARCILGARGREGQNGPAGAWRMRVASCCRSSTEGGIRRDVVRNPPLGAVMYVGLIIPGLSTYYIQRYINNGKGLENID